VSINTTGRQGTKSTHRCALESLRAARTSVLYVVSCDSEAHARLLSYFYFEKRIVLPMPFPVITLPLISLLPGGVLVPLRCNSQRYTSGKRSRHPRADPSKAQRISQGAAELDASVETSAGYGGQKSTDQKEECWTWYIRRYCTVQHITAYTCQCKLQCLYARWGISQQYQQYHSISMCAEAGDPFSG
jgi:hypothetical protein